MSEPSYREKVVTVFAEELATKQRKADYWFYIEDNSDKSSRLLEDVDLIKRLTTKLGIVNEVYEEALKIYNFSNSGKRDYKPNINELSRM